MILLTNVRYLYYSQQHKKKIPYATPKEYSPGSPDLGKKVSTCSFRTSPKVYHSSPMQKTQDLQKTQV